MFKLTSRLVGQVTRLFVAGCLLGAIKAAPRAGVVATFEAGGESDAVVLPNFWLHVRAGGTPTPFLAPGPFTAVLQGNVSVELRGVFTFQAEVNGSLVLDVNGTEALRVSGDGSMTESGPRVRLNKGTNAFALRYTPASTGDAHLRLFWVPRDSYPQLIPDEVVSCVPGEAALAALQRHRGRGLFLDFRCGACHAVEGRGIAELSPGAPTLAGIGSRRNAGWLIDWLRDPVAVRSDARMPAMFHGGEAIDNAEAVAAYLVTLTDPSWNPPREPEEESFVTAGRELFDDLHCHGCHATPGEPTADGTGLSLDRVRQKFSPGSLAAYLGAPARHYEQTRMPGFRLTNSERGQLSAYLLQHAAPHEPRVARPELAPHGRELVQNSGCLNCHKLGEENQFRAVTLAELRSWDQGCLSPVVPFGTRRPRYTLTDADREALQSFGRDHRNSLTRHVDGDFALRQVAALNCAACHERQIDLVPPLGLLGGKLKPEWSAAFIAGRIADKPRPWFVARMPSFPWHADGIASGLANLHGFPAQTGPEEPVDAELAFVGYQLVGGSGGFACTSCHGIGRAGATQVVEAAGINFALTADRLQHDYFVRWMLNPLRVDPAAKMPVYFDEQGSSPLFGILRGKGRDQIEAMWHYFRQREAMRIPPGMGSGMMAPSPRNSE